MVTMTSEADKTQSTLLTAASKTATGAEPSSSTSESGLTNIDNANGNTINGKENVKCVENFTNTPTTTTTATIVVENNANSASSSLTATTMPTVAVAAVAAASAATANGAGAGGGGMLSVSAGRPRPSPAPSPTASNQHKKNEDAPNILVYKKVKFHGTPKQLYVFTH